MCASRHRLVFAALVQMRLNRDIALFPKYAQAGWRNTLCVLFPVGGAHETPQASPAH